MYQEACQRNRKSGRCYHRRRQYGRIFGVMLMHNFPYDDQSNLVLMRVPVYLYIDDFEIGKPIEVNGYGEHSTGNLVL